MERIQEALAKARAQRQQTTAAPRNEPTAIPEPAPVAAKPVEQAWETLAPFKFNRSLLKHNRVISAEGGHEAAPYDVLRTKIIHQAQMNDWRRVAIVSADTGAGKSTTLANLAFSFERQRDMRVICIDFDLRRPTLHKILEQKSDHSMPDVLNGHVRFSEHGVRLGNRVAFGFNNAPAANPSEILMSKETREALATIEQDYAPDLMFFDIPPLNASDDNIAFLQNVDCAVIVAAAESTKMSCIDNAERQVAELTNVMGILLNKCRYVSDFDQYGYY